MIGAFFAPRILIRSSVGLAVILSSTLVGLCLIIVSYVVKPEVWHFVRFFIGFGTAVIFVSTNSLLATLVKKEKMGKIFGLYNTITSCGFAIGPLILTVDGKNLPITFLGLFILLVASIFFFQFKETSLISNKNTGKSIPKDPIIIILVVGAFSASMAEQSIFTIGPIYLSNHFTITEIGFLLTSLGAGSVMFQLAIGWMVDRYDTVIIGGVMSLICVVIAQCINPNTPFIQIAVAMFLFGGISYGIYTVMIVHAGKKFEGKMLVGTNGVLTLSWSLGGLIGPPLIGYIGSGVGLENIHNIYSLIFLIVSIVFFSKIAYSTKI